MKFSVDGRHLATVSVNRGDGHAFEANLSIDAASHEVCATAVGRGPSQLANTCFRWARTNMGFANDLGLRNDFTFSENWGVVAPLPHETRGVSWTLEDVNTAIPARTPSQVASVNANYGKPDSPLGFMQLAVRSRVTTHLDQIGVRAHFIPTVQVYESATGGIATRRSLNYARSQEAKGVLPIFNITPQNLNAATITTIRRECINFNGRIGVWAIDSCNQVIGRRSAPSPGL